MGLTRMECLLEAQQILEETKKADFERIIIFGLKDDKIHSVGSSGVGRLETMGAMFAALMELWGRTACFQDDTEEDSP